MLKRKIIPYIFAGVLVCAMVASQAITITELKESREPVEVIYTPAIETNMTYDSLNDLTEFDRDAALIAQTMYGEAGILGDTEKAAVAWVILSRVDSDDRFFPDTIEEVIKQPNQFVGYRDSNPVTPDDYALACDVLVRWRMEKLCVGDVGRVIPAEYVNFHANSDYTHNIFTAEDLPEWDWSLHSPYSS